MMVQKWLAAAVIATVAYHLVLKVTPAGANPYLSLAVTYTVVAVAFFGMFVAMPAGASFRTSIAALNWTALALGLVVVVLDLGFLMLYRSGFDVSLGQLITQSVGSLLLLLIGIAWFRERLTLVNIAGILLCVAGLWLISRR